MALKLPTTWNGVYSYDPFPGILSSFVDTAFVLNISPGWLGRFTGEIRDSEPGIQEPASVKGWAVSKRIRFAKTYSSFWISDEQGKLTCLPGIDPYVLHYDGRLSGSEGCWQIQGTWYISAQDVVIDGQRLEMPQTTGTWSANSTTKNAK